MIGGVNIKYINSTLNKMQHEVYIYMLENSQANNNNNQSFIIHLC